MTQTKKAMSTSKELYEIRAIPVLKDNIIWVWVNAQDAVVVDPALTAPVKQWLQDRNLNLIAVLQTHHHSDHIGGTKGLIKTWPKAKVIAAKSDKARIPFQTLSVSNGEKISLMKSKLTVIEVAGHTKNHIAYYLPKEEAGQQHPALFCGDTLFGGGCGRLFEGSPEDMHKSLKRFSQLPSETRVYCAHEYTEENLRWASSLYPDDKQIKERFLYVSKLRQKGQLTLLSTISEEISTNLFLRAKTSQELARLRKHKDAW